MSQNLQNKREKISQLSQDYGYSKFMIKELMVNFPKDYMGVIRAFDKPPLTTIRTNTLRISPEELKTRLEDKGFSLRETKWIDYGFIVNSEKSDFSIGATHEYLLGYYYIQDFASMIPVHLLAPQPGDNVLDMCAAPGGKTTHMGQLMEGKGTIIATDINESRIKSLISNVNRCGLENCVIFPWDGRKLSRVPRVKNWPNKILLDAPCTGSGVIRKDPSRKTSRDIDDIKQMSEIQKQLLKSALSIVKPGGLVMYSTCSFHYRENEQVVAECVADFNNVYIVEPYVKDMGLPGLIEAENREFGYDMLKTRRLYPNLHDSDAFFYCLMEKKK